MQRQPEARPAFFAWGEDDQASLFARARATLDRQIAGLEADDVVLVAHHAPLEETRERVMAPGQLDSERAAVSDVGVEHRGPAEALRIGPRRVLPDLLLDREVRRLDRAPVCSL